MPPYGAGAHDAAIRECRGASVHRRASKGRWDEPAPPVSSLSWGAGIWGEQRGNQQQNLISFAKLVSGQPFPAKFLPEAN